MWACSIGSLSMLGGLYSVARQATMRPMIVLNALPTLGGTYVWQRAFRNHPAQEGVRLSVGGLPNARDAALRYLAAHLADLGETWFTLVDGPLGPWRLDLSQLAKRFSLSDQLWLSA